MVDVTGFENFAGLLVTPTGDVSYTWQIEALSPGGGGAIVLTGVIDPGASGAFSLTNEATISSMEVDERPVNNMAAVSSTIDAQPPLIVAISPPAEAEGVAVAATIVITFSEAISRGSFAFSMSPNPGDWKVLWNDPGTTVTLGHEPWSCGAVYTVMVNLAIDRMGNPLAEAPYVWHFTTASVRGYLPLVLRRAP